MNHMSINYNIYTYLIYLPIIVFITVKVGWLFYKNGEIFLYAIFENASLVKSLNKILLVGYYLINIGYSFGVIAFWAKINSMQSMIESLATVIGTIILSLAIMHYNNIIILKFIAKRKLIHK